MAFLLQQIVTPSIHISATQDLIIIINYIYTYVPLSSQMHNLATWNVCGAGSIVGIGGHATMMYCFCFQDSRCFTEADVASRCKKKTQVYFLRQKCSSINRTNFRLAICDQTLLFTKLQIQLSYHLQEDSRKIRYVGCQCHLLNHYQSLCWKINGYQFPIFYL